MFKKNPDYLLKKNGFVFPLVVAAIMILTLTGLVFITVSAEKEIEVRREIRKSQLFWIAEAGVELAASILRKDFTGAAGTPSWADGFIDIYNLSFVSPDNNNFYTLLSTTSFGSGTYTVMLKNVSDGAGGSMDEHIIIKSEATVGSDKKTIEVYVKSMDLSVWNNAAVGGYGFGGWLINGNVTIAGSILIYGEGLTEADYAIDLSGSSGIYNYYKGMNAGLKTRLPALPKVDFGGEVIDTLNANVWVKNGKVRLSGSATIGEPDVWGNGEKETMDGIFITDGAEGTNFYSDNGIVNNFNLDFDISFPAIDAAYVASFSSQAYNVTIAAELAELADIKHSSNFILTDGTNTLSVDGAGNMVISGNIYVNGPVNFNTDGSFKKLTYSGNGTILAKNDISINAGLVTPLAANTFPTNIIALLSEHDINIGVPNSSGYEGIMGVFYASNNMSISKQTQVVGSIGAPNIDMGSQVPSLYQVPDMSNQIPGGVVQNEPDWHVYMGEWEEY